MKIFTSNTKPNNKRLFLDKFKRLSIAIPLCIAIFSLSVHAEQQDPKRVEVYALSQNYWDTQTGDTLSEIIYYLLPNNPSKRETLKQDIVHLNPLAFNMSDPNQLLAGHRLWMPGYMKKADSKVNHKTTTVERYSWGNIKRQK